MTVIEARELTKRFGEVQAVDGLSFALEEGTVTGFLGPNGAGKTTTLRMLLGLVTPTAGAATVLGKPYRELVDPALRVGAVLEASGVHPGRRAADHLRVVAAASGAPTRRVAEVLEFVGLATSANRRVKGFSLGMRQRLALDAALLGNPSVLILDEPANGLDPEGIQWLRHLLRQRAGAGCTVVVSSHVLAAKGQMAELRDPDVVVVLEATTEEVGLTAAGHGIVIYEMTSEHASLEDTFFELTSSTKGDFR